MKYLILPACLLLAGCFGAENETRRYELIATECNSILQKVNHENRELRSKLLAAEYRTPKVFKPSREPKCIKGKLHVWHSNDIYTETERKCVEVGK